MKLVGISGALIGAKTAIAVNDVLKAAQTADPDLEIELLDLSKYNVEFVTGKPLASYNEDTQTVITKILDADFLVIGTPVYQASITGALKNLFDHLPTTAFQSKVIGMVITAGSPMHYLVGDSQLLPILSFFKAIVATNNVFVYNACFNENNEIVEEDVVNRIQALGKELVELQTKLKN